MNEEIDEIFQSFAFYNHQGQFMTFDVVKLDDMPPNSSGVFMFINRIGTRNIKLKVEPEGHKILGIYFLSEKNQIESMIDKFKAKSANYLLFKNCSEEQSESIINYVRSSKEWTDEDLIKID